MKKNHNSRKKYIIWATIGTLAVLLIGFGCYKLFYDKPVTPTTTDGKPVNLNPATNEDKTQSEAHKNEIVADNTQAKNTPSGSAKQSSLVLTEVTATGVRAYVTGVFEEGGVCTASATMGSQVTTKTSQGFQNASYTQCAPINWDTPLSTGSWAVKVTYKSATTESTQSKTIDVR